MEGPFNLRPSFHHRSLLLIGQSPTPLELNGTALGMSSSLVVVRYMRYCQKMWAFSSISAFIDMPLIIR